MAYKLTVSGVVNLEGNDPNKALLLGETEDKDDEKVSIAMEELDTAVDVTVEMTEIVE